MIKRSPKPLARQLRSLRTSRNGFGCGNWKRGETPPKRIRDEIERRKALVRLAAYTADQERWERLVAFVRAGLAAGLTLSQIRNRTRAEVDGWSTVEMRDVRQAARECRD